MKQPNTTDLKKISLIAFSIAILGITCECLTLLPIAYFNSIQSQFFIKETFSPLHILALNYFPGYFFTTNGIPINFINLFFYILLLLGVILFVSSRQKEARFIRLVMSVVFISNLTSLIISQYNAVFQQQKMEAFENFWLFYLLSLVSFLTLIYLSWFTLTRLSSTKKLDEQFAETDGTVLIYLPTEAPKWQRFCHQLIDTFICFIIILPSIFSYFYPFFEHLNSQYGEKTIILIVLLISRTIYYPCFEILFGATPAKFLTESRVVSNVGRKPSIAQIIKRTLSRHIPFEPFSFFAGAGWHDSISDTLVIKEIRTGVVASKYLLIIPVFIATCLIGYIGKVIYKDHQSYLYEKNQYNNKVNEIKFALTKLSSSDIIQIQEVPNSYSDSSKVLKIKEIKGNDVTVAVLNKKNEYSKSIIPIEQFYETNYKTLLTTKIKLSDLKKAFTPDYDKSITANRNIVELLNDGKKYEIVQINSLFEPYFQNISSSASDGTSLTIAFCNYGWPTKIIAIERLEGDIVWNNSLPIDAPSATSDGYPEFSFRGTNYQHGQAYKFKITTAPDSLNQKQVYLIEGKDFERTITRLK